MKNFTMTTAALALLAAPAFAGGPTVIADDPVPVYAPAAAAVHDWSGPYVGLSYGKSSGSLDYDIPPFSYDLASGNTASIFAGYLIQRGSMVYGGELALSRGKDIFPTGFPTENVDRMLDLKGKVGFAANRALFYGVLGYSRLDYEVPALSTGFTTSGYAYGIGVDFAATNRLTVGLEYLARKTDGDSYNAGQTAEIDLNTLSLRVGLSF